MDLPLVGQLPNTIAVRFQKCVAAFSLGLPTPQRIYSNRAIKSTRHCKINSIFLNSISVWAVVSLELNNYEKRNKKKFLMCSKHSVYNKIFTYLLLKFNNW